MDSLKDSQLHTCIADCACCPVYKLEQRLLAANGSETKVHTATHDFSGAFVSRRINGLQVGRGQKILYAAEVQSHMNGCSRIAANPQLAHITGHSMTSVHSVLEKGLNGAMDS